MALVSPGVEVTITDESSYVSSAESTVPFVIIATAENKRNATGIAPGTTKSNANKIFGITSQRELTTTFGTPIFRRSAADTPLHGDELNEYGLMAAYSALGLGNRAWVVRADIDLDDLVGTSGRPAGSMPNNTNWFDIASTSFGLHHFDETVALPDTPFVKITPRVINSASEVTSTVPFTPLPSVGDAGEYAVVTLSDENRVYYKNSTGTWIAAGSSLWADDIPVVISSKNTVSSGIDITPVLSTHTIVINQTTVTWTGNIDNVTNFVANVNAAGIAGVTASVDLSDRIVFRVNAASASTGITADGKLRIADGLLGTVASRLGLLGIVPPAPTNTGAAATVTQNGTTWTWDIVEQVWRGTADFARATVHHGSYVDAPLWRRGQPTARPTGSLWVKTSVEGSGANFVYKRYSSALDTWSNLSAKLYTDAFAAVYGLDPVGGGINIAAGSIFVKFVPRNNGELGFKIYTQRTKGVTKVTGNKTSGFLVAGGESFSITAGQPNGTKVSAVCTVPTPNALDPLGKQKAFVQSILNQNIPNVTAQVETSGAVSITHRTGGVILLAPGTGSVNAYDDMGFADSVAGITQFSGGTIAGLTLSNWEDTGTLYEAIHSATEPAADPADGKLWYYHDATAVDIMISDATGWRGYRNVAADARGYDLTLTDPKGIIISATEPATQQDGGALQSGDLWLDSSDLENYPKIYRYDRVSTVWTMIDNLDNISQNGILFADARWGTANTVDPISDPLPSIQTLTQSDYIDIDAPDYRLYPRGTLLFNTRRSGYIVKRYVENYFNRISFPDKVLPPANNRSAWVSTIGFKDNGNPAMGHYSQRNEVIQAMKAALDSTVELREEGYNFNILAAPGYPELIPNLVALNNDRSNTGFVIGDTPMLLTTNVVSLVDYARNITTASPYLGIYYPSALSNDLGGNEIVVPASHMMLRTFLYNDQVSYPWFAPAGTRRGLVDNALAIGYIDANTGSFVRTGINNNLRDVLYDNNINPITLLPGVGILAYGQKTRSGTETSMNRVNVARLVNYLRTVLQGVANQFLFEPNDKVTRDQVKHLIESLMNDLIAKRGLYDYLVVCDETNNTADRISRNELYVDVAIEPMKSVEFIYIPIRLRNPGTIDGSAVTTTAE